MNHLDNYKMELYLELGILPENVWSERLLGSCWLNSGSKHEWEATVMLVKSKSTFPVFMAVSAFKAHELSLQHLP